MFKNKVLKIFIKSYMKRWRYLVPYPFVASGISILALLNPWILRIILDNVIPNHQISKLFLLIGTIVGASILAMVLSSANSILFTYGSMKALNDIRSLLIHQITRLPKDRFSEIGASEMLTRVSGDINNFGSFISNTISGSIGAVSSFSACIVFLSFLDTRLMCICFAVLPLEILSIIIFKDRLFKSSLNARNSSASLTAFVAEVLLGISTIRSLRMETTIIDQLQYYQKEMLQTFKIENFVTTLIGICRGLLSNLPTVIVLGYGGVLVMRGEISIGSLIAFYQVVGRLYAPINNVMGIVLSSIGAKVPLSRIDAILGDVIYTLPVENNQPKSNRTNKIDTNALIHFNNVTFLYKQDVPVLNEINFHIPPKMTTLIIGPSGSGKTTIAQLLTQSIKPNKGSILIGKEDISMLPDNILYQQIAMVEQSPVFFSCSIKDNLLFASPFATEKQVQKALWVADIENFIEQLPEGLNTKLNDRGANISGGEMRRLALARAILTSPQILILDETTSSVEPFVERRISQRIRDINPKITLVMITHRMNLAEDADMLVFIEKGQVTGVGSHQHLYTNCSSYRELYFEESSGK